MTEYGGSIKGLKQNIIQRSTEELARDGVKSPAGNPVDGHDELTPAEMRGVLIRGGNETVAIPTEQQPSQITDPVTGRIGEAQKAGE